MEWTRSEIWAYRGINTVIAAAMLFSALDLIHDTTGFGYDVTPAKPDYDIYLLMVFGLGLLIHEGATRWAHR